MQIQRFKTTKRMSQAIVANGFVFLSGQVANDTSEDVGGQTRQILEKIDALLAEAGCDKSHIVQTSIWLADHKTFDEMNAVWDAWTPEGCASTRACVESALAFPQYTVEIGVIAAL